MPMSAELWQANLLALFTAFIAIKVLRPIAIYFHLVDVPNARKQHDGQIPLIGGLSIYMGVLVAILAIYPIHDKLFYLLLSASLILLSGLIDDLRELGAWVRILIMMMASVIMIKGGGIYVDDIGNLLGTGNLQIGLLGIPFTIFAVVGLVNAINMSDGIDGLTGSLALAAIIGVIGFESITGNYRLFEFLIVMATALIPYLLTNLTIISKRKIFLGDAGSMFIGFVLAWVLIELSQGHGTNRQAIQPVNVLWCVALPVIDTLTVILKRLKSGRSPFSPDRSHFHHVLLDKGYGPRQALMIILTLALTAVVIGWLIELYAPMLALPVLAIMTLTYMQWARRVGWHHGVVPTRNAS